MQLNVEAVAQVARLARLRLESGELVRLTADLARILTYVEQLDRLDLAGVEPLAHVADYVNVFDEDVPRESLPRDEALANAPHHDDACFRVPAVL
ncbi:MAG: Asp-tRNA(Asn)/Glu-tRNA(Gln) amidotransferase subunit GatC [Planctomycetes bacterium]|nr:Asp-tRNA(Asn)/Glu-tRNA(Gln) amidotransferase subunit GatC [Planctomycetota bacterium]